MTISIAGTYSGVGAKEAGTESVTDVTVPAHDIAVIALHFYNFNGTVPDTVVLSGATASLIAAQGSDPNGNGEGTITGTVAYWCTGAVTGSGKTLSYNVPDTVDAGVGISIAFLSGTLTTSAVVDGTAVYTNTGTPATLTASGQSASGSDWVMAAYTQSTSDGDPDELLSGANTAAVAQHTEDTTVQGGIVYKAAASSISIGSANYCSAIGFTVKASGGTTYEQEGYRWRNDDGSESAATWKASQDTSATISVSTNVRLRTLLNRTG